MHLPTCSRRKGLSLGLGIAAALPGALSLHQAQAQPLANPKSKSKSKPAEPATPPDWLATIKQHHDQIARSFDALLEPNDASYEQLDLQLRTLDQWLLAHSMAEETLIYPAMARAKMLTEAEKLYMDEAHIKIAHSQLELAARIRHGADWRPAARALREKVLRHAREDEEARLFPELHKRLDEAQNWWLSQRYPMAFSRLHPLRT